MLRKLQAAGDRLGEGVGQLRAAQEACYLGMRYNMRCGRGRGDAGGAGSQLQCAMLAVQLAHLHMQLVQSRWLARCSSFAKAATNLQGMPS